jgi:excisionase family DNA binding protein
MNKKEAAAFLGCSERAINRYISKRQLSVKYEQGKHGAEAIFDKEELKSFKAARTSPLSYSPAVEKNSNTRQDSPDRTDTLATVNPSALAPVIETLGASIIEHIFSKFQAMKESDSASVPTNERLTLTLDQASSLSGLSKGFLRAAIHSRKLKAAKRGRGWNIKRMDLDVYVKKL